MESFFKNKKVLVTGACGTVGSELIRQLLHNYEVRELIGLDNSESELFFLEQQFSANCNARFFLADIRDQNKLSRKMRDIEVVFHCAAYKHVVMCERSPFEAVQTNIIGVQNVIAAATANQVDKVVFTSSDKAVNPTSVMGTSKLMGERLFTAANSNLKNGGTIFASTRFGNVLGSRGSVIPIFREQIRKGGPLTLTHPGMTRFIMSIREAVRLVINSTMLAKGGEVFVTKMPVITIKLLAEVMIDELAPLYGYDPQEIKIEEIGFKPGEKVYEELMSLEETRRALELKKYFAILPAFRSLYRSIDYTYEGIVSDHTELPYNSENQKPLRKDELKKIIRENQLLTEPVSHPYNPSERYWPDEDSCAN